MAQRLHACGMRPPPIAACCPPQRWTTIFCSKALDAIKNYRLYHEMARFPIITSLPPSLRRLDRNGGDIGAAYQRLCVQSWREAGFHVLSLNAPDEIELLRASFPDVEFVPVTKDGRAAYGKPYVYLHDAFRLGESLNAPSFGLINADILLSQPEWFAGSLTQATQDASLLSYRMDRTASIMTPGAGTAAQRLRSDQADQPYIYGFDVFFFNRSMASLFQEDVFAIGVPWWDLWVPLNILFHGHKLRLFRKPIAVHLDHQRNWQNSLWRQIFRHVVESVEKNTVIDMTKLRSFPSDHGSISNSFAATFLGSFYNYSKTGEIYGGDDKIDSDIVDGVIKIFSNHCVNFIYSSVNTSLIDF